LGYKQDKVIERRAFEAADKQRVNEIINQKAFEEKIAS